MSHIALLVCPQLVSAHLEQNPYLQWWPDICTNKIPVPSVGHLWYLPEHLYYYLPEHHHGKLQVGPRLAVGFPGSWCCRTPNSLGVSHLYNFSTTYFSWSSHLYHFSTTSTSTISTTFINDFSYSIVCSS